MPERLSGKVCIVTGTGGSMGRATALTFAREGALVVGCDVAAEPAEETLELVEAAGGEMVSLQPCVLGDPAECARLVELAVSRFGRIDVVFNLAGRSHFGLLESVSDEDWDAARRDEVDLIFYLTRAAWPQLIASSGVVAEKTSGAKELYNRVSLRARAVLELWQRASGRDDATLAAAVAPSTVGVQRGPSPCPGANFVAHSSLPVASSRAKTKPSLPRSSQVARRHLAYFA